MCKCRCRLFVAFHNTSNVPYSMNDLLLHRVCMQYRTLSYDHRHQSADRYSAVHSTKAHSHQPHAHRPQFAHSPVSARHAYPTGELCDRPKQTRIVTLHLETTTVEGKTEKSKRNAPTHLNILNARAMCCQRLRRHSPLATILWIP